MSYQHYQGNSQLFLPLLHSISLFVLWCSSSSDSSPAINSSFLWHCFSWISLPLNLYLSKVQIDMCKFYFRVSLSFTLQVFLSYNTKIPSATHGGIIQFVLKLRTALFLGNEDVEPMAPQIIQLGSFLFDAKKNQVEGRYAS